MNDITFESLGLSNPLLDAVNSLGFEHPSQIQELAIPRILKGDDIVGLSETGSGKTAAFTLPALDMIDTSNPRPQVLILSPTRELCVQVCEEVQRLGKNLPGMCAVPVYGGAPMDRQIKALQGSQMVVGTPGRLMDHLRRGTLRTNDLKLVILDEADRMLDMGFREDMEEILGQIRGKRQTLFFSATMNRNVEKLIQTFGNNPATVQVEQKTRTVEAIDQMYYEVRTRSKVEVLSRLLDTMVIRLAVVFCNTKRAVDEVTEALLARGYAADRLHGDVTQQMRERVLKRFRDGSVEVLVATDVAARGLDIDEVDVVFNYDLPQDFEDYIHRVGRTGRAGREGKAVSFVFGKDVYRLQGIEKFTRQKIRRERIPSQEDVEGKRADVLFESVKEKIEAGGFADYKHYIDRLLDQGHTATDIASALFSQLRDTMGREGEEIQEDRPGGGEQSRGERSERRDSGERRERSERGERSIRGERKDRPERGERRDRGDRPERSERSRDREGERRRDPELKEGMTQLFIGLGSKLGVNPGEIAGMIYSECSIKNGSLGRIRMFPKHCLVQVNDGDADKICADLKRAKLRGKSFATYRDRDI
jgi:ATP-dependent RNA helicase DeaD